MKADGDQILLGSVKPNGQGQVTILSPNQDGNFEFQKLYTTPFAVLDIFPTKSYIYACGGNAYEVPDENESNIKKFAIAA